MKGPQQKRVGGEENTKVEGGIRKLTLTPINNILSWKQDVKSIALRE